MKGIQCKYQYFLYWNMNENVFTTILKTNNTKMWSLSDMVFFYKNHAEIHLFSKNFERKKPVELK